MRYLPLDIATTLQLLGPLTLALLSSRRPIDAGFAVLAASGVWLFHVGGAGSLPLPGVLLALGSGASMVVYLFLSRHARSHSADGSLLALDVFLLNESLTARH